MLTAYRDNQQLSEPWLIWLHGLLGSADEWLPIVELCPNYPSLRVDLPGHGASQSIDCHGFTDFDQQLTQLIEHHGISQYYLIGYSLGARLAMHYACYQQPNGLCGLIVEGGNVGLNDPTQRTLREQNDYQWAQRFRFEPIETVLNDWYQQAVFAHLTADERQQLISLRRQNNPQTVANILENTSLAKQPFLVDKLSQLTMPFRYFCGERDQKFRSVSQQYSLPITLINNAGHNAHRENPHDYAAALHHFLSLCG